MLDWSRGGLATGLACYSRQEFFEAHEHWEAVWLTIKEPEKSFLQSLIQMTAAFHHLQRNNRRGAMSLLRRTLHRLEHTPAHFGGIAAGQLRAEVHEWLRLLDSENLSTMPDFPKICPISIATSSRHIEP
jgi:uncharacterized protein